MHEVSLEGIVLDVIPYRDNDLVVSVFTKDHGLVKLMLKGRKRRGAWSKLSRGEFLVTKGRGDLWRCHEAVVVDTYVSLRQSFEHLSCAIAFLDAVRRSQMPEKPAIQLYQLMLCYLERLPEMMCPQTLACSYYLKVLRHEGLLCVEDPLFTAEEQIVIVELAHGRSFAAMAATKVPELLFDKIKVFFVQCCCQS